MTRLRLFDFKKVKRHPQTVPDLFNQSREQWLEGARNVARELLQKKRLITIEDVLEVFPRPKYLHRNLTGRVFATGMFKPVGYTPSKRRLSHKRIIRLWTLSDVHKTRVSEKKHEK